MVSCINPGYKDWILIRCGCSTGLPKLAYCIMGNESTIGNKSGFDGSWVECWLKKLGYEGYMHNIRYRAQILIVSGNVQYWTNTLLDKTLGFWRVVRLVLVIETIS